MTETRTPADKPNDDQSITKPNKKTFHMERPGALDASVILKVNTVDAQTVFSGTQSKDAIGLLQFASRMTLIYQAAALDDPYADWYLLRVYNRLVTLSNRLTNQIEQYDEQLAQSALSNTLHINPFGSRKPITRTLWFSTPYGYLGAKLIAEFDTLMRIILTSERIGVFLDRGYAEIRNEIVDQITQAFKLPFKWQGMNATRQDANQKTPIAIEAEKAMGTLPEKVLSMKLRSPFAPDISKQTAKILEASTQSVAEPQATQEETEKKNKEQKAAIKETQEK